MATRKRKFSYAERYAVWHNNERRCWLCPEPLRLQESTIDHVLPEWLLSDDAERMKALHLFGLGEDFAINGFENWLPSHGPCNQSKSKSLPANAPLILFILRRLVREAQKTRRLAEKVARDVTKDKVLGVIFSALEKRQLSHVDLEELLRGFRMDPKAAGVPDDVIVLSHGYWVPKKEIVAEGLCRCERNTCVDMEEKTYCYFEATLPQWVVRTGLFWKCYDEIVTCPRCSSRHKRGHIGRLGTCDHPYADQEKQLD